MSTSAMTFETVLREIKKRYPQALQDGSLLQNLFLDFSRGKMPAQCNQLEIFLKCDGNTCILGLEKDAHHRQQLEYVHLVQKMVTEYSMQEAIAVQVCSTFWRVALEAEPPEYTCSSLPEPPRPIPPDPPQPIPPAPEPPAPNPRKFPKVLLVLALAAALLLCLVSFGSVRNSGGRKKADLAPFKLEEAALEQLLAGTQEVYTYPDNSRMEFYYDDSGKETFRLYVDAEEQIENLFEAQYDSAGMLTLYNIYDAQGNTLRTDQYLPAGYENAVRRSVYARHNYNGISTFAEDGTETFEVTYDDGSRTVYVYAPGGMPVRQTTYDPAGEIIEEPLYLNMESSDRTWIYGPWSTPIGWRNPDGGSKEYVLGLNGAVLKEYYTAADYSTWDTYDGSGNPLEMRHFDENGTLTLHYVHSYDDYYNYTGYTEYFYFEDKTTITVYDENGIKRSQEIHHGEEVIRYRFEIGLDDQGREIRLLTYDADTGRRVSIDETEYDDQGNVHRENRTFYFEDGSYSVTVRDGEGTYISEHTYFPNGKINHLTEYNSDGSRIKRILYYENGQIQSITEYNDQGETVKHVYYNQDGTLME